MEPTGATEGRIQGSEVGLVKNMRSKGFSVIDTTTYEYIGQIGEGKHPHALAISSGFGYVPYMSSNFVEIIDLASLSVVGKIEEVGDAPVGASLTNDGRYLFVTSYAPIPGEKKPGVSVIDTKDNSITETVSLGKSAGVVTDTSNDIWVTLKDDDEVVKISGEPPFEIIERFGLPSGPQDIIMSTDTSNQSQRGLLGVNSVEDDKVTFIENSEILSTVEAPNPRGGSFVEENERWFVSDTEGDGITVIDINQVRQGSSDPVLKRVSTGSPSAFTDVTPDGSIVVIDAYNDDKITFLDTDTLEILDRVETGDNPHHPQFGPEGNICYVPNMEDETVSVVNVEKIYSGGSAEVVRHIEVPGGTGPSSFFQTQRRDFHE